jgi:hypothetical protein
MTKPQAEDLGLLRPNRWFIRNGRVPAGFHTKALWPVIVLPTIKVFISRVPSKE